MISPLREIAHFKPCSRIWDPGSKLALESFGNGARFPVLLPRHSSPDFTLNCLSRPFSLPDSKFLRQKKRGVLHRASRDARVVEGKCRSAKSSFVGPDLDS